MTEPADTAALAERIRELESENERLAAASPVTPKTPGGRWRAFVSALLIVIASLLVPVSIVTAWARIQLVDEESFVATLAPLVDDPAVQAMIIEEALDAIDEQVDFAQLTSDVFDGIADLGLPPRAEQALRMLEAPAASGLQSLTASAVTSLVESDAFSDVWATTTRAAHRALTMAATSDGGGIVVRTSDGVGIQIGAIVEQVKQNLVDRGVGVAQIIPSVDRVVLIGEGDGLTMIRTGYALATVVGWWLPVLTLALFVGGILVARRRSAAILGTGIGFAFGAGALATTLGIGSTVVDIAAGQLDLSPSGLGVIYTRLVADMAQTSAVLSLLGVFIALLGWVMGRSRSAAGVRGAVRGLNSAARRGLAARGVDTGGFGVRLARQRVVVRIVVAALAVVWLFLLRPLSLGDVLLVLVLAVAVAWILELLQRRDGEQLDAAASGPATDDEGADTVVIDTAPAN